MSAIPPSLCPCYLCLPSPMHLMFLEASTARPQAFRFSCHNCSVCTLGVAAPLTAFLHESQLPRYALHHLLWLAITFVRASRHPQPKSSYGQLGPRDVRPLERSRRVKCCGASKPYRRSHSRCSSLLRNRALGAFLSRRRPPISRPSCGNTHG